MHLPFENVLALSPHTDDVELGCGGTLARLLAEGAQVHVATFSIAKEAVPEGLPQDVLATEFASSMESLGIKQENQTLFDYPVRRFETYRQAILQDMINLRNSLQPDLILMPTSTDIHQDHQIIHNEAIRAFKFCSMLGYELPWNNLEFNPGYFVRLSSENLSAKLAALEMYQSQITLGRRYFDGEYLKACAVSRAGQCGLDLAESFEVFRIFAR